MTGTYHQIT